LRGKNWFLHGLLLEVFDMLINNIGALLSMRAGQRDLQVIPTYIHVKIFLTQKAAIHRSLDVSLKYNYNFEAKIFLVGCKCK
jgi:hypothetical protein